MSGGSVFIVHGLMGIFDLESGECQSCGDPARLGAVVEAKSTVLLLERD